MTYVIYFVASASIRQHLNLTRQFNVHEFSLIFNVNHSRSADQVYIYSMHAIETKGLLETNKTRRESCHLLIGILFCIDIY